MNRPELSFGGLRIEPPLLLAPMAGLTHSAFRRLLAALGGVGLYATEMLSARSVPVEDPRRSPYLLRSAEEAPLAYQLLAAPGGEVIPAIRAVEELGADVVDLNLGCPAPQARRRGAGGWLMDLPEAARRLVAEARSATRLPLTAKIRLGKALDEGALREFCLAIAGEGVDAITVHARLRGEPYGRPARWEWIGKVKSWVDVPVVGNGGIFSAEDASRCLAESGCDGLMLGRGVAVRPWLAATVAREVFGVAGNAQVPPRPDLFARFFERLEADFPETRRLGRLKEFTYYFSQTYPFGHHLASAVQGSRSMAEARARAERFFRQNDTAAEGPDP